MAKFEIFVLKKIYFFPIFFTLKWSNFTDRYEKIERRKLWKKTKALEVTFILPKYVICR